jgi:hypothetical protein
VQRLDDLSPLEAVVTRLATRITDEKFLAGSDAWQMALQFYALIRVRSGPLGPWLHSALRRA